MAGKRKAQKAATHQKLLVAAKKLFTAGGYDAVGIRDVTKEIGMSTGVVFVRFGNKGDLWAAAMGCEPPDVEAFLDYVAEGKFDTERGNDGAEAKLDEMAHRALELKAHLYGRQP